MSEQATEQQGFNVPPHIMITTLRQQLAQAHDNNAQLMAQCEFQAQIINSLQHTIRHLAPDATPEQLAAMGESMGADTHDHDAPTPEPEKVAEVKPITKTVRKAPAKKVSSRGVTRTSR